MGQSLTNPDIPMPKGWAGADAGGQIICLGTRVGCFV